jgi:hypothetical protein
MFTVALCTSAEQASLIVTAINRKVDRIMPIKHRAKICPWRYCWAVKVDQFALDILEWPPLTDIDEMMANCDDMTNALNRLTA